MLSFFFFLLILNGACAQKQSREWRTLRGESPVVVARGGYSGLFPESSQFAYQIALATSFPNVTLLCNLHLSKDRVGLCRTEDLRLENSTNIAVVFPNGDRTYSVNGKNIRGWFSVDYTLHQLQKNVFLTQNVFSRPSAFDSSLPLFLLDDLAGLEPSSLWINVQYNAFFKQHKLDMEKYLAETADIMRINYLSSPEIGFLKAVGGKLPRTKLVLKFLDKNAIEPSTNTTYGTILDDLKSLKSFVSGILVPKNYIWPVNEEHYLQPHTTLVPDAHQVGLDVYAYGFANDALGSYNYSYDPSTEYLQFIDDSEFSVDGLLTDYPSTASVAIACMAHNNNRSLPIKGRPLVIAHNGASGVYAGSTDLAFQRAVEDGADVIECSVQLSNDQVPFCMDTPDLTRGTTAIVNFMSRASTVPEIQGSSGIFSFDLTWNEIETLKPEIVNPMAMSRLQRNPAYKNQGKLLSLSEFLSLAEANAPIGVLINIQNAAFLASKKGLDMVGAVTKALDESEYLNQTNVFIQSDDTSVLNKFKHYASFKKVLLIEEMVSSAAKPVTREIKQIADAVNVPRASIVGDSGGFLTNFTSIVDDMHSANLSVYVSVLRNEFTAIAYDFFADPTVEICTYVLGLGVDGVVTEFPRTATSYFRSPCYSLDKAEMGPLKPAQPGSLIELASKEVLPPSSPAAPALTEADVLDPPLPPVADLADGPDISPSDQPSGQIRISSSFILCIVLIGIGMRLDLMG